MGFNCTGTEIQTRDDGLISFLWFFITLKMLVIKDDINSVVSRNCRREKNMAVMNLSSNSHKVRKY